MVPEGIVAPTVEERLGRPLDTSLPLRGLRNLAFIHFWVVQFYMCAIHSVPAGLWNGFHDHRWFGLVGDSVAHCEARESDE